MKYLCLAYGSEKDWNELTESEQNEMLAHDDLLRKRGDFIATVGNVTTVRAWDGTPNIEENTFANLKQPLVGFSIIEAANLNEAIELVWRTPCARAKGAIEIRPIMTFNDAQINSN